jgi:hypothetical protein
VSVSVVVEEVVRVVAVREAAVRVVTATEEVAPAEEGSAAVPAIAAAEEEGGGGACTAVAAGARSVEHQAAQTSRPTPAPVPLTRHAEALAPPAP